MKVEENMILKEKIYTIKNQIQEEELRYLSMEKINENKRGYMERLAKERIEIDEILRQAK